MSDIHEAAEKGVSDERGRRKTAELHTSGAKHELKLGEGGGSDESWPSDWRWRRGVFVRHCLGEKIGGLELLSASGHTLLSIRIRSLGREKITDAGACK